MRPTKTTLARRVAALAGVLLGVGPLGAPRGVRAAPGPGPEPEPVRAERLSVEPGLHGGAVVGQGLNAIGGRGAGAITFRALWPVGSRVRLGLRVGLLLTALPFGQETEDDDQFWIGVRPSDPTLLYDGAVVTLIPSVAFLLQVRLWRWLELDVSAGLAAPFGVWKTGAQAALVSPQLGAGLLFYVYRHRRAQIALRVGVDTMPLLMHPRQPWLFMPMGGLLVRIPVHENPPSMQQDDVPDPFEGRFRKRKW